MFKRALSLIMCVLMLASAFVSTGIPLSAERIGSDVKPDIAATSYSGVCGAALTWEFDTETGVLLISGSGIMYDFQYSSPAPWAKYASSIKSIVIGNSVTSIGNYAFRGCTALTEIVIPVSVMTIGTDAFYKCSSLTSITIPYSVVSIDDFAFYGCASLSNVYITDIAAWCKINFGLNYSNPLQYAENLYLNEELLTDLVIPDSIKSIEKAVFDGYKALTSVKIPESVTSIGNYAFNECSSLTTINIPKAVTSIGRMAFYDCTSLETVHIRDLEAWCKVSFDGEYANPLKYSGKLYLNGEILTDLVIPESITAIGDYSFMGCTSIETVTLHDSVTSIGQQAFENCTSLNAVYISDITAWCNIDFERFDSNPLYYAKTLYLNNKPVTDLVIPNSITKINNSAFINCTSITKLTIPDSVTSIGVDAFNDCDYLVSVTMGDSVKIIDRYAFYGCDSLTDITISDSVTSIGDRALAKCVSLTNIVIPDSVKTMGGWVFYGCDSLESVTLGNSVEMISAFAFENCSSLKSLSIGRSVNTIGSYAFANCTSLTDFIIPDSVIYIRSYAFNNCNALESVTVGTALEFVDEYAFSGCNSLTSVHTKDLDSWCSIEFYDYHANPLYYAKNLYLNGELVSDLVFPDFTWNISSVAFYGCTSLKSVTFSDSNEIIGSRAFQNCTSLETVVISDSVTDIGYKAFFGCEALKTVTIPRTVTAIAEYAFDICPNLTVRCYENSYAHKYAIDNALKYELILCDHVFTNYTYQKPTCTADAAKTAYCDNGCGTTDVIVIEGTALGHTWSEWVTKIEPTYTTEGKRVRSCKICSETETETIPVLFDPNKPVITVDNYTVTITKADNIRAMRYALGRYTTPSEIKAAEGNVPLNDRIIKEHTVDGSFVYEMPKGGYYTIWIRMTGGSEYILPLDVTHFTPEISINGVTMTLHNLYNVKDFYIAKGEYNTYRELKNNGYIFGAGSAKIGNKHDYTYTVYEPGIHTVLIRYNDGTTKIFHEELTVTEPTFAANGLQVTIGNIPDVKVIRTAYGKWNTVKELKATDSIRNFTGKADIKDAEEYTISYQNEGTVTVIVEYNNGYKKVFHCEIS